MRLSTSMIYQQNMNGILNGQSIWQKVGEQLASGTKVSTPSDDPIAASQAVMIGQAQAETSQFTLARTFSRQNMSLELTVLESVVTAVTSASTTVISAGGVGSNDDRNTQAEVLEGLKAQLLNIANTTDGNGNYIFAGYQTTTAPYVQDPITKVVTYTGGHTAISQQVDSSRTMTVSNIGPQVFNSATGDAVKEPDGSIQKDLFATLDIAINVLKTPIADGDNAAREALQSSLDTANRGLRNSLNNVSSVQSTLGIQLEELDQLDAIGADRTIANSQAKSALVDTDWVSAISTYVMQQASLQAAYTTYKNMSGMSLFQINW
ncbi:flagellar hook-filament junction protein FlgL [Candidatus Symbiopectobacterium sp. 'North America']|uniref:flagellar hook-associated protein FlgL n=1 Tax=Candidatus Symbiopectobacterium sp. 'North America' TaxID=2794574 RepID=UPI0018CBE782|nr:flagellar hook-associated protein FlgL [Candidatus Symbiopectobacterium sp. 'North America']MBG6245375.1 flagellar hook-filament junction protein FlgL [Candidatus Symbiopectobacterium sp. 'North America']